VKAFFFGAFDALYTSEALKKENVKENLGKARLSIRQFSPFNCLFSIE